MGTTPVYEVVSESGPDHDKRFVIRAAVNGRRFGQAKGSSKKEAEQAAALLALKELLAEVDPKDSESLLLELPDDEDVDDQS